MAAEKSEEILQRQATITQAQAEKTALAKVPDGKIVSIEILKEEAKLFWSLVIKTPKAKNLTAVHVDAKSGKSVSFATDTSAAQDAKMKTIAHTSKDDFTTRKCCWRNDSCCDHRGRCCPGG
ncbi:MAG TPA: PepSY domain-containing protein [Chthoniobacteraceae bacterium]|jgi:hypothetical protein|nr:PepSY domain-containing protein [Chthoniobacteraceae bacterium]